MFARLLGRLRRSADKRASLDAQSRAEVERERRRAEIAEGEGSEGMLGGTRYDDSEFRKPR
jgi:hypothetical protein